MNLGNACPHPKETTNLSKSGRFTVTIEVPKCGQKTPIFLYVVRLHAFLAKSFVRLCTDVIRFVTNYAKKIGDYAFLSAVDLRLLASTYQLYEENVGTEKLNLEPKINTTIPSVTTSFENAGVKLAVFLLFLNMKETQQQVKILKEKWKKQMEMLNHLYVTALESEHDYVSESPHALHLSHHSDGNENLRMKKTCFLRRV